MNILRVQLGHCRLPKQILSANPNKVNQTRCLRQICDQDNFAVTGPEER